MYKFTTHWDSHSSYSYFIFTTTKNDKFRNVKPGRKNRPLLQVDGKDLRMDRLRLILILRDQFHHECRRRHGVFEFKLDYDYGMP
jgi:hypothetical protein